MVDEKNIPILKESGSSGLQKEPSEQQVLVKAERFSGYEVAEALEGIAASSTRLLGGEVGSALLAASWRQLALDNNQLQEEN